MTAAIASGPKGQRGQGASDGVFDGATRLGRRLGDLVLLCDGRIQDGFGGRLAKAYAWGIAASYGVVLYFVGGSVRELLLNALFTLAWIAGGFLALSAARDLESLDEAAGVTALVVQRGFSARALELARSVAAARRIAVAMGLPAAALAVVVATRARSFSGALNGGLAVLGAVAFCAATGLLLAVLARGSAHAWPGRGRTLFAVLVLVPHAAKLALPWLPSVPSLFSGLGELLIPLGLA